MQSGRENLKLKQTRWFCCFFLAQLLSLLADTAWADGKVFATALEANVSIPDQRALIHFTNGVERLVIETRFTGAGTNFAWVVPLPSPPVIEQASAGLFPTLQHLFRPELRHYVPIYYPAMLGGFLVILLLIWLAKRRSAWSFAALVFVLCLLAFLLLPMASSRSMTSAGANTAQPGVSVLDRRLVGVYDTAIVTSKDAKALQSWLNTNGFALSGNVETVIASYVKEGWVFAAAKLLRNEQSGATNSPHPLSFTFKTDTAVYPTRLTGVDNGPVRVDLYVFGPGRASASHFRVEHCARPTYPALSREWVHWNQPGFRILHPLLRRWVSGTPVATKLSATLSPANMRKDIRLAWQPFSEVKSVVYSPQGAATLGANWAATIFVIGWIGTSLLRQGASGTVWRPRLRTVLTLFCAALAGLIYIVLPKTEVRLVQYPGAKTRINLDQLCWAVDSLNATNAAQARAELSKLFSPDQLHAVNSESVDFQNELLGGRLHEEDSPGNYTLEEVDGSVKALAYDAYGEPHDLAPSR